jgi:DNA helicase-4
MPFAEFSAPTRTKSALGFSTITFFFTGRRIARVAGLRPKQAAEFASAIDAQWYSYLGGQFKAVEDDLRDISKAVRRLFQPQRYPAACLLEPFFRRASAALEELPENLPDGALTEVQRDLVDVVKAFHRIPHKVREAGIKAFADSELQDMKDFFDGMGAYSLTPEQRLAVIADEDATLVLAGAGSGKTTVIVTKAAYLIERGIRSPTEILLMAFGKDAATEMARRIREISGASVDALTFHALGYSIIRQVEGTAPALAPHASDEAQLRALLRNILINDIGKDPTLARLLVRFFSEFYQPYKSEWDFKTRDEYYSYIEAHELRSLKGDLVKSFEELEIANWFYLSGIGYEYEPVYEHELPENDRRVYTPDFRLTESGVYIEHFGVRKAKGPGASVRLTTAPFVDRTSYLEGMAWKRQVHRKHGTTLIETYSYERVEGRLLEALREKVSPYAKPNPIPQEQLFDRLSEMGQVDAFTQTLGAFLRQFKNCGATIEQCRIRGVSSEDPLRSAAFLSLFESVLNAYQRRLGDRIDFEDMILRAAEYVESGRYQSPYRHLIVDEFQDISAGRARLLRALKAQHPDARVFAVGDDWQSIYRFAGSDISLMRNFGAEFGGTFAGEEHVHIVKKLGMTFRSVDRIALPARKFVLQNPSQIEKKVIPAGAADSPAIKVAYYASGHEHIALNLALDEIGSEAGRQESVMLLGRYRHLLPRNLSTYASSRPALSLRYMTGHASKGLEADHVVILHVTAEEMGFPSEIVDDPLLDLVLPEPEQFDHAEERRLFYVALTRARRSVTVLADREKPSVFVRELVEHPEYGAIILGEAGIVTHRCVLCGGRMLAHTSKGNRVYFACEHRRLCGHTLLSCAACGSDIPVRSAANPERLVCSCGAEYPACPECADGWLVERKGPYSRFLGCVRYPECRGTRQISDTPGSKERRS